MRALTDWTQTAKPPKAKKQRTKAPAEVDDEEVAVPVEDDEEDDDDEEAEVEDAGDTAKKSGPAGSAKDRKGKVVPREADLDEVEEEIEEAHK